MCQGGLELGLYPSAPPVGRVRLLSGALTQWPNVLGERGSQEKNPGAESQVCSKQL